MADTPSHKASAAQGGEGLTLRGSSLRSLGTNLRFESGMIYFRFAKAACGGGGGIRTPGTVSGTPDFESGPFDHSGTPPQVKRISKLSTTIRVKGKGATEIKYGSLISKLSDPGRPSAASLGAKFFGSEPTQLAGRENSCRLWIYCCVSSRPVST